jgi:hypothetical protein
MHDSISDDDEKHESLFIKCSLCLPGLSAVLLTSLIRVSRQHIGLLSARSQISFFIAKLSLSTALQCSISSFHSVQVRQHHRHSLEGDKECQIVVDGDERKVTGATTTG